MGLSWILARAPGLGKYAVAVGAYGTGHPDRVPAPPGEAGVDDPRGERVARQEAHLSRELDRALAQLERLRGMRPPNRVGSGEVVSIHVGE